MIDTSVAHEGQDVQHWLGGKDNYPADRALAEAVIVHRTDHRPDGATGPKLGVRLRRSDEGDAVPRVLGSHLTKVKVRDVSKGLQRRRRAAYPKKDLIEVLARCDVQGQGRAAALRQTAGGDLQDPPSIIDDLTFAELTSTRDEPVGIMLIAILMLRCRDSDPREWVRTLLDVGVPSGSHLTITHATADFDPVAVNTAIEAGKRAGITFTARTHDEVESLFGDLELVDPGVVPVLSWKPELGATDGAATPLREGQPEIDPKSAYYYCGVGRKP